MKRVTGEQSEILTYFFAAASVALLFSGNCPEMMIVKIHLFTFVVSHSGGKLIWKVEKE